MSARPVLALCGGVGGAKLAHGLAACLPGAALTVLVNTGDDFEHLGLHISPDIDSVLYTLSGRADRQRGWGRAEESWNCLATLAELGLESWFQLGDRDLALHLARSQRLRAGASLSAVTAELAGRLGLAARILPMSDAPVATLVETDAGTLAFQDYFVRRRCAPAVRGLAYAGAERAAPPAALLALLADPALAAVVLCPSNPHLSLAPMLAMPALRAALAACPAPLVGVSPLVGGQALKGPLAKLLGELGLPASQQALVEFYRDRLGRPLDGWALDRRDAGEAAALPLATLVTDTVMTDDAGRARLAREVLEFAGGLANRGAR